jgi:simple sugar transport system permease protein
MDIIISMMPTSLMMAAPIIVCALGGLFSERSGVVNIALEGIMLVGAFTGATVCYFVEFGSMSEYAGVIALVAATLAGAAFSLLLAVSAINFKADQTIAGVAVNMLAAGITVYLCQLIFDQQRTLAVNKGIGKIKEVPLLSNIPILGDMFFTNIYPTIFIAIVLVFITYYVVYKTSFGLRLRACGEPPQAAESMGVNVYKTRYAGVMISGAFGGLAGAMLVLTAGTQFTAVSIHGIGFISIAALIFGKWNPFGVLGAGLFFGISSAIGVYASLIPLLNLIPSDFLKTIPYILTIVALVVFSGKAVGPKASGEIYDKGKR